MKTAELLETLRTRQPLSWRQVRDRLPLSLPRQSRLDLASDDRYPQESDYGTGPAIAVAGLLAMAGASLLAAVARTRRHGADPDGLTAD